jgi:hypothetical protein
MHIRDTWYQCIIQSFCIYRTFYLRKILVNIEVHVHVIVMRFRVQLSKHHVYV